MTVLSSTDFIQESEGIINPPNLPSEQQLNKERAAMHCRAMQRYSSASHSFIIIINLY